MLVVWLLGMITNVVICVLPQPEDRRRWMMKTAAGAFSLGGLLL